MLHAQICDSGSIYARGRDDTDWNYSSPAGSSAQDPNRFCNQTAARTRCQNPDRSSSHHIKRQIQLRPRDESGDKPA